MFKNVLKSNFLLSYYIKYICVFLVNFLLVVMPNFAQKVEVAVNSLNSSSKEIDENEFIDASRLVYDGVRDIRQSVLLSRVSCFFFHL